MMRPVWMLVWCLLLSVGMGARSLAAPLVVDGGFAARDMALHWEVLEDPDATLTPANLPATTGWSAPGGASANAGFSGSAFWFRARLESALLWPQRLYLQIRYPLLSEVDVYWQVRDEQEHFHAGHHRAFSERVVAHRHFVFPVNLAAQGEGILLLRVRSAASVQVPAELLAPQVLLSRDERDSWLQGIILGIPFVMFAYNLLLYLSLRERNYLLFTLHAFWAFVFIAILQGVTAKWFFPESIWLRQHEIAVGALMGTYFSNLFTEHFLGLRRRRAWIYRIYRVIRVLIILMLVVVWFVPVQFANIASMLLAAFSALCISIVVVINVMRGGRAVRIYSLAWFTMILGVLLLALNKFGVLSSSFFAEECLMVALDLELLMIAFALGDRLAHERSLKIYAQETALRHARQERAARERAMHEEREAQAALLHAVEMQRTMHDQLEQQVQERTRALEQAHQRLLAQYEADPLTGVKNRRHFAGRLHEECHRAHLQQRSMALLLLDIDHFKRINDQYGHLAGDACIRHLADVLSACFGRAGDCVARYGGEEFAVVMAPCDVETACRVTENLRERVQLTPAVLEDGTQVTMTVSLGLVVVVPEGGRDADYYLHLADKALYQAKSAGRNQVCQVLGDDS